MAASYNLLVASVVDAVKDTIKEKKEEEKISFTNTCRSISSCSSINRIIKYLDQYSKLDVKDMNKIFNQKNFPFLSDDFNHILLKHLSDNIYKEETQKEYERIYDYITQKIEGCKLEKCFKFQRNNRNRENEKLLLDQDDNKNNNNVIDEECKYYIEIMDTMHCFFVHTFDVGFRIKSNELNIISTNNDQDGDNDNDNDDDDDKDLHKDSMMENLFNFLETKRKRLQNIRGLERSKNSKFVTNVKEENEEKQEDEEKQQNINDLIANESYSFGFQYNYWKKTDDNYVKPKYSNISEELLNNNIFRIDIDNLNMIKKKAKYKLSTEHAKAISTTKDNKFIEQILIKDGTPITMQHILSILLYTDFDSLSYNFSTTFRALNKTQNIDICKKRNGEYGNWSKLLSETVNAFGNEMGHSKIKIFYHGINCLLIFSSFLSSFYSPTSTTASLSVATIFAKENGAILELVKDYGWTRYFDCTWLSSYANEDERLYCNPPYEFLKLRFKTIRCISTKENYETYIHALTSFNYTLTGNGTIISQHNVNKKDLKIIKKLIKHYDDSNDYKNSFPQYINNIFYAFVNGKQYIKLSLMDFNRSYPMFKSLYFEQAKYVLINNICNIFKKLEKMQVEWQNVPFKVESDSFDHLIKQWEILNKKKLYIEFHDVEYDGDTLHKNQLLFKEHNCHINYTQHYYTSGKLCKNILMTRS